MLYAENEALKARLSTQRQSMQDEIDALNREIQSQRLRIGELVLDLEMKDKDLNKALKGSVVQRIPDVPKHTTIYVPDPILAGRNKQLVEELEVAIVDEGSVSLIETTPR